MKLQLDSRVSSVNPSNMSITLVSGEQLSADLIIGAGGKVTAYLIASVDCGIHRWYKKCSS